MKQDPPFDAEKWRFGYLVDTIFTRDTWMHRLDISRATSTPMGSPQPHDGRLVADVVAEWGRRHGQPFSLTLTGTGRRPVAGRRRGRTSRARRSRFLLDGRLPPTGYRTTHHGGTVLMSITHITEFHAAPGQERHARRS